MNLCVLLLTGVVTAGVANLDFRLGKLTHWEGDGFTLGPLRGNGPSGQFAACSAEGARGGKVGILHRTLVIPPGTTAIRFQAAAIRPAGVSPLDDFSLDVILEAAGVRGSSGSVIIPKQVWTTSGCQDAATILPPAARHQPRDYVWNVSACAGRRVRIALIDRDSRPNCFVMAGGFRLVAGNAPKLAPPSSAPPEVTQFIDDMRRLQKEHRLAPLSRFDSRHFVALSNASSGFTEYRLSNCETIHPLFFEHFRRRGFAVREPNTKLMVAVFDSQVGFESYLGRSMSNAVTGIYHPSSNRLVVYDFARNRAYLAAREKNKEVLRSATTDLERERLIVAVNRFEHDRRTDTNISTVMHEVAHQLSFNGGLLNRQGDVPLWLAEGLACYCESTVKGSWQGIGEPNPQRVAVLVGPVQRKVEFIPLQNLVSSDDWIRKAKQVDEVLLGYSQSWALFGWLMRDHPRQLRRYLEIIRDRRTPEHRLADFGAAFGSKFASLEKEYRAYMREVVRDQGRTR